MAQYYQIQNLDDIKHIYTDVQVVHVASDDVGVSNHNRSQVLDMNTLSIDVVRIVDSQLLLPEEQILLNDGQQLVYQTTANQPTQYQQQGTTHYIIGEDINQQQQHQQHQQHHQQQTQHQQLMYQSLEHHQQQNNASPQHQQQQQQQHYQQDTQEQSPVQVMQQDHQVQHIQQQSSSQQQQPSQQQVYYTTDHILQQNSIVQHSPHSAQQQDVQQQQLHIQQQYQQQQQHIVHQQHAMQPTQQHQVQVDHQPQQQIVYRMQPQQHQQTQMMNNAHVIVQQPSGQQLLIQSPQHQEIIMRQPMQQQQQRIVYNTNRVVYSPQQQTQTPSILQQSSQHQQHQLQQQQQHHQQQQQPQQHIQLQTSPLHTQARLIQTRVTNQPQPQQVPSQQLQQGVVFHQIQAVGKSPPQQHIQIHQQPQLVASVGGMRGAIRPKAPVRTGFITAPNSQVTRMATSMPAGRSAVRASQPTQTTSAATAIKSPARPRSSTTAGNAPRTRGTARGARGGATVAGGRGGHQPTVALTGANMQVLTTTQQAQQTVGSCVKQTQKNITIASLNQQGQVKQIYRSTQIVDYSGMPQHQLQLVQGQAQQRSVSLNAPRFRSPSITTSTPNPQASLSSSLSSSSSSSSSVPTSSGGSGNGGVDSSVGGSNASFELDLEDSIQAVVVKKEQQKAVCPTLPTSMPTTTLTTYYGAKDDDENRIVRTQNGTCITLAEFKKRNAASQNLQQQSNMSNMPNAPKSTTTMRACAPPSNISTAVNTMKTPLSATTTSNPSPMLIPQAMRSSQSPLQTQIETAPQPPPSSSVHQTSHNNYEIQTQQVLQNRSGQQMAEKDRNSAKMLVILASGEQRLITFTLPRESCTVQDLLEQVGVPFDNNTTIQCVENPGANVDFVVTVGFSVQESTSELISRAEQSLQMSRQQENVTPAAAAAVSAASSTSGNSNNSAVSPAVAQAATYSLANNIGPPVVEKTVKEVPTSTANFTTTTTTNKPADEVPRKVIQGFFAICHLCGFSGFDHAKCERCKRVFTEPPKRVPCVKSSGTTSTHNDSLLLASRGGTTEASDKKRGSDMASNRGSKSGLSYSGNSSRGRGNVANRGRAGRNGRRNAETEPVILTLSSDEEGDKSSNKSTYNTTINAMSISVSYKAFPFESTLPDHDETHIYADFEREDVTDLSNWPEKLSTTLECKMVRIGVYRFEPQESIMFTSKGFCITAPLANNPNKTCSLHIHKQEVIKVIAHFSNSSEAMLCFCTLRTCAQYVKNSLNMTSSVNAANGSNQLASVGLHEMRRIILQFDCIPDQARHVIKSIWNTFDEISFADAQNLLRRAAEYDVQTAAATSEQAHTVASTTQLNVNEFRQLLIYPSGKGGISITTDDYLCLGTDQYLNDIIIDFYLKWVHNNIIPLKLREKTFIFSTFFYKRLTTLTRHQHQGSDVKQTAAQKRHSRVQNWTKNVNLFEKDFIIIPINEQSHWFLAIICFPWLKGPVTFETNVPVEPQQIKKQRGKKVALQIGNTTITPLSKREANTATAAVPEVCGVGDEDSERDEAEGDESDLASDDSDFDLNSNAPASSAAAAAATTAAAAVPSVAASSSQDQAIKQPLILIFDSLAGASRSRVVATLRDYLTCEYKAKMGDAPPRIFNKDNMHGHGVKVPQQNNFTDCGLFLLQYVEQFFIDPVKNYRLPIKQLTNWFDTLVVTRKREDISTLLQRLMNEKNGPQQKVILPEIPFPTLNGQLIEQPESANNSQKDEELEEDAADEHDDSGGGSSELDVDAPSEEMNGKQCTTVNPALTSALVPTQGRKIVMKRRFPTAGGKNDQSPSSLSSLQSGTRSVLKVRKLEQ